MILWSDYSLSFTCVCWQNWTVVAKFVMDIAIILSIAIQTNNDVTVHTMYGSMTVIYSLVLWNTNIIYIYIMQIKICAEYRDMLPRPRLVCQEPGLRPIGRSPGVPVKSSRGQGSMSRYSAQILICFIAYIFQFFLFLCGFGWEFCRAASMHSALCHCPL